MLTDKLTDKFYIESHQEDGESTSSSSLDHCPPVGSLNSALLIMTNNREMYGHDDISKEAFTQQLEGFEIYVNQEKSSIDALLTFQEVSRTEALSLQTQVMCLYQNLPLVVTSLLSDNYSLDGRTNLIFNFASSEDCQQKYIRNGRKFMLEFFSPIFTVSEGGASQFELDVNGQLQEVGSAEGGYQICEVKVVATLDLSKFPKKGAMASYEITIMTSCSNLHYIGPQDPTIKRIETSIKSFQNVEKFNPFGENKSKLIRIEQQLEKYSAVITLNIGTISGHVKNEQYNVRLLLDIVLLFNQALTTRLLKHQSRDLRDEHIQKKVAEASDASADNLTNLIGYFLRKNSEFRVLLTEIKQELIFIFSQSILAEQITQFFKLFFGEHIERILAAATYLSQEKNGVISAESSKINNIVLVVIDTMRAVLNDVANELHIETTGFLPGEEITTKEALPKYYLEFLKNAEGDTFANNPFQDLLAFSDIDTSLIKALSTLEKFPTPISSTSIERHSSIEAPQDRVILYLEEPPQQETLQCCPGNNSEKKAALWNRNPVFQSLTNLAMRYAVVQFLRLFPGTLSTTEPYLVVMDVVGGAAGLYTGMQSITNPNKRSSHIIRIYKATSKASVVLVGTMAISINAYLLLNPNANSVSNTTFLGEIAPAPIMLSTLYLAWESFPNETKEKWFSRNFTSRLAHKAINVFSRTLLYAGVFEFLLLNIFNVPGNWGSLLGPIAPALLFALLYHTRIHEKIQFFITALTAADFAYMLIRDAINQQEPIVLTYSREVAWVLLATYSTYFTAKNAIGFVKEYQDRPPILISQVLPIKNFKNNLRTDTINDETQQLLRPETWSTLPTEKKEDTLERAKSVRKKSGDYESAPLNDNFEEIPRKRNSGWFGSCNVL